MNLFVVLVAFLLAFILVAIIARLWGASYVASQPVFTWDVRIIAKRQQVISGSYQTDKAYYITFEFADKSQKEYQVDAEQYGLLAEGDRGKLYTQANQFKGFE